MLFQRFPIRYRRPDRTPIQLFLAGNRLLVSCNFAYSDTALNQRPDGCSQTYAELVADGIRTFWSGDFRLPLPDGPLPITVEVQITSGTHRRAVPIRLRHLRFMPAHVISPWYRRFWGLLRTGQLESMGTNWSVEQPGVMILPYIQDPGQVRRIAAHEAGHLFGLGDAYGAIYRFYDAAPDTEWYMMHGNWAVQPAEVLMMLRAHQTSRMQFFPRSFNWVRFRTGFAADVRLRLAEAEAHAEQRRKSRSPRLHDAQAPARQPEEAVVEPIHYVDNEKEEPTAAPPSEPIAPDRIPDRPDQPVQPQAPGQPDQPGLPGQAAEPDQPGLPGPMAPPEPLSPTMPPADEHPLPPEWHGRA